ncbi:MAG: hypothetical protein ACI9SI_000506 [Polaribacter sp.]|jgi:hypothetical protein
MIQFKTKFHKAIFFLLSLMAIGVIGFKASEGNYIINPEASIKLIADSSLIVLGRPEQIVKLRKLF